MAQCFVIQPFNDTFNKRYDDVYFPAIEKSGLTPYRIDRDPSVDIVIDSIEKSIRDSAVCLADITLDNPNVWYELGYAFAQNKKVVLICSDERTDNRYPFDIQHRSIINYKTKSLSDFEKCSENISAKITAYLESEERLEKITGDSPIVPIEGLSLQEFSVLAAIAENIDIMSSGAPVYTVGNELESQGFSKLGYQLGLRGLQKKNFVALERANDERFDPDLIVIQEEGWAWIEQNHEKFVIKKNKEKIVSSNITETNQIADDIPF